MIDHARLLELLDYNPETGKFTRKVSLSSASKVGDVVGTLTHGYLEIYVDGKVFSAHRLAWFYVYQQWPIGGLDHIDLDKTNNAIKNLRPASQSQNGANTRKRVRNSSGFKGVTPHGYKYKSAIMINRKRLHLGVFESAELAANAYDQAAVKHYGEFALTNQKLGLLK